MAKATLWQRLAKAFQFSTSARTASYSLLLPGSSVDYGNKAGNTWQNGAVAICLNWIATSLLQTELEVERERTDGEDEAVPNHPLPALVRRPNAFYTGKDLWQATLASYLTDGNAYWMKVRGRAAQPVELWYVPHWLLAPAWPRDGSAFISHYVYNTGSGSRVIPIEDVIHFRAGLDPLNPRVGLSTLKAQLREIVSDNEASTYIAALLANMGVIPIAISPADPTSPISDTGAERIKTLVTEKTTGGKRGEPIVLPGPVKIDQYGLTPEQLTLDRIRQYPEARIAAALQVPPQVVGLNVGEGMKTYANYEEARLAAWQDGILPLCTVLAETLDIQLLPDFSRDRSEHCEFDTDDVDALADDQDATHLRAREDFKADIITRAEARTMIGALATPIDEVYYSDLQMALTSARTRELLAGAGVGPQRNEEPAPKGYLKGVDPEPLGDDWAQRVAAEAELIAAQLAADGEADDGTA